MEISEKELAELEAFAERAVMPCIYDDEDDSDSVDVPKGVLLALIAAYREREKGQRFTRRELAEIASWVGCRTSLTPKKTERLSRKIERYMETTDGE